MKTRSKKGQQVHKHNRDFFKELDKATKRKEKRAAKLTHQLEPTYWETASIAAIALSVAIAVVTFTFVALLTFG